MYSMLTCRIVTVLVTNCSHRCLSMYCCRWQCQTDITHCPLVVMLQDACINIGACMRWLIDHTQSVQYMCRHALNFNSVLLMQVLYSAAPIIHLMPCQQSELRQYPHYDCPLYCTPERRGVLATTGHSTNFVMDLMVPSDRPQDHWCRRGVAFLLSLAG